MNSFLPISSQDMADKEWDQLDFVLVTGDAYVDHPSFGAAVITRVLEAQGFRVGIIAQPDWTTPNSLKVLGRPRLGFLVTSGNLDSMVNHYTAAKKKRRQDAYTPGGKAGKRPDRAAIVYANLVRQAYKGMPVILGGLEASLRRMAHYDYWKDSLRRSILLDSKADLVIYGMGERAIKGIAAALDKGRPVSSIREIPGTLYACPSDEVPKEALILPSHEELKAKRSRFAQSFRLQYENADPFTGQVLVESYGSRSVVQNPPAKPLTREEMDEVYALPYAREAHPSYTEPVPAVEEVKYSLVSSRGCFGACAFCALAFHQGRIVKSRSHDSLMEEAQILIDDPGFKGYIHDVGGPTANFRDPACAKQGTKGACPGKRCLAPEPCKALKADHGDYIQLLRKLRSLDKVKKVFIRSGIRFDYLQADTTHDFLRELCEHHVSGQLKVAPEHVSPDVLRVMGKPKRQVYERFVERYGQVNAQLGKKQYLVPYFISGHPGSRLKDAIILAEHLRDSGFIPDQVQDFYPTPGTLSTCMWYTGIDPMSGKNVHIPSDGLEKAMQRALLQYNRPENRDIVRKALRKAGRGDLIGRGPKCLVPAEGDYMSPSPGSRNSRPTPSRGRRGEAPASSGRRGRRGMAPGQNAQGPSSRGQKSNQGKAASHNSGRSGNQSNRPQGGTKNRGRGKRR
ncbi:MAG: YgiQ family radical SAM protein [Spirochaetales bacterium]|nr:YgiQ family radical SAM protein [Spirochaetales bacterium]